MTQAAQERTRRPPVICLMGSTATGKTDAAAALSEQIDGEIISVDSALVYRGLDIGTAKPDKQFLSRYPHHLVDIRNPDEVYSVAEFYAECRQLIAGIVARGRVPILAGGTHFYFAALERGLSDLPSADQKLRAQIEQQAQNRGWPALHAQLGELDPVRAASIDPADAQRIQRALEIVLSSGQSVAEHAVIDKAPIPERLVKIALAFSDRSVLHERIAIRFDLMLEQGFEQEVTGLLDSGLDPAAPAFKLIGYRQMLEYLQGDSTYEEMKAKGIAATRQLAKRQLTWLRNQSNVLWWMDTGLTEKQFDTLNGYVQQILR